MGVGNEKKQNTYALCTQGDSNIFSFCGKMYASSHVEEKYKSENKLQSEKGKISTKCSHSEFERGPDNSSCRLTTII